MRWPPAVLAICADTAASASAPTDMPVPASLTKSRRFMKPSKACHYPHQVSPGARCARTTSGFNSMPSPGLSVT